MTLQAPLPAFRRAVRLAGWNALFIIAGLALIVATGEIYLRLSVPFMTNVRPWTFVPGVGVLFAPNAEVRATNNLDFWTVSRTNRWGFLDREPISPDRAAESCHIAVIGDSFVQALQVPISDKFHVRLEYLATRELPDLDVTSSAFGRSRTAQASQLPYYDEYARRLSPKLLVLVFVDNDFMGNSGLMMALHRGWDPDEAPFAYPERTVDGKITLRLPSPEYRDLPTSWRTDYSLQFGTRMFDIRPKSWLYSPDWWAADLYFGMWLRAKIAIMHLSSWQMPTKTAWAELLSRRPRYESPLAGVRPINIRNYTMPLAAEDLNISKEAFAYTAFALEQFVERAERDNVSLVILSEYRMGSSGHPAFDRLNAMAEERGIAVINLHDYLVRQGQSLEDVYWDHDGHWNSTGHQRAAEALLEYLRQHPEVCAG